MDTKTIITSTLSNKINSIISLCITIVFSNLFLVLSPLFVGRIIDHLISSAEINLNTVLFNAIVAGAFLILRLVFEYIKVKQVYNLGNYVTVALQKEAYNHIMKADYNDFNKVSSINLTETISKDCVNIGKEYISKNIVKFTNNLVYLIIVFIDV